MDDEEFCIIEVSSCDSHLFDFSVSCEKGDVDAPRGKKDIDNHIADFSDQESFDDLDDYDNSNYDDDSNKDYIESMDNSHQNSEIHIESTKSTETSIECEEQTLLPGESSCLSSLGNHPTEYSEVNEPEGYHLSAKDVSNIYCNHRPTKDDSSSSPHSPWSDHSAEHYQIKDSGVYHLSDDVSNVYHCNHRSLKDDSSSPPHSSLSDHPAEHSQVRYSGVYHLTDKDVSNVNYCNHRSLKDDSSSPPHSSSSDHPAEHSQVKDSGLYHLSDKDVSNVYYNHRSLKDDSSSPPHSSSSDHPAEHFRVKDSEVYHLSDKDVSDVYCNHRSTRDEWKDENVSLFHSNTTVIERKFEHSDVAYEDRVKYSQDKRSYASKPPLASNQKESAIQENEPDWKEKFRMLQVLFQIRGEELNRVQNENILLRNEIEPLLKALTSTEGEKNRFFSILQEYEKSISEYRNEISELKDDLAELRVFVESAPTQLQSAETTNQCLDQQMNAVSRSENALCMQVQNENVIKDFKLGHQKVPQLTEEIDRLQESLDSKVETKSSGRTFVVLFWMWNWFAALVTYWLADILNFHKDSALNSE